MCLFRGEGIVIGDDGSLVDWGGSRVHHGRVCGGRGSGRGGGSALAAVGAVRELMVM